MSLIIVALLSRTILRLPIPRRLCGGFTLKYLTVLLRHLVVIWTVRQMVSLAATVATDLGRFQFRFCGLPALRRSNIPGRNGLRPGPQSKLLFSRCSFSLLIRRSVAAAQFFRLRAIEPCVSAPYLLEVDVTACERHLAYNPPVGSYFQVANRDRLSENQI